MRWVPSCLCFVAFAVSIRTRDDRLRRFLLVLGVCRRSWGTLIFPVTGSTATERETGNGWESIIVPEEVAQFLLRWGQPAQAPFTDTTVIFLSRPRGWAKHLNHPIIDNDRRSWAIKQQLWGRWHLLITGSSEGMHLGMGQVVRGGDTHNTIMSPARFSQRNRVFFNRYPCCFFHVYDKDTQPARLVWWNKLHICIRMTGKKHFGK